jgi:hypothetical protein
MTYIIQNRIIQICENEKDYGEYFKQLFFPSKHHLFAQQEGLSYIFILHESLIIGLLHQHPSPLGDIFRILLKEFPISRSIK